MANFPEQPFAAKPFSVDGGGVDVLGLRWVTLKMLGDYLLPGINNLTQDFGVYCLATWIPWKFQQLCKQPADYVRSKYDRFRERVEVAISHSIRTGSPAVEKQGDPHGRIGVRQKLQLPSTLSFAAAKRTDSTSLYAAPLYGPSLRYLGLICGDASAADGSSTGIPVPSGDNGTLRLIEKVERQLARSPVLDKIIARRDATFGVAEIDDLGVHGLNPASYRSCSLATKRAFIQKLLPHGSEDGDGRALTAKLMIDTLRSRKGLDAEELRAVWHTGLFADGSRFQPKDERLRTHRDRWAIFQARQYQRFVIEQFARCFEIALQHGASSIEDIVDHATEGIAEARRPLRELCLSESKLVSTSRDPDKVSSRWNSVVHGEHEAYVGRLRFDRESEPHECRCALRMVARWWFQTRSWLFVEKYHKLLALGGEDRVSSKLFIHWVGDRLDQPIKGLVRDIFEHFVFAQHLRVALSRFDGQNQRLRFVLGDRGIVPTHHAAAKLADGLPGWTPDRLDAFTNLLLDVSVLQVRDDGGLEPGELADEVAAFG